MKRALVVINMNDESNSLVRFIFPYAERHRLYHIDFIHVEDEDDIDVIDELSEEQEKNIFEKLESMLKNCHEASRSQGVSFNLLLNRGIPEEEIINRAREIHYDLVVMGPNTAQGIEGFLSGNTGLKIMDNTTCNVLIYKSGKTEWMVQY